MPTVRVLLVDSNDDFLDGLSAWLGREPDVEILGTAKDGREAVELAETLHPDLLLMDVSMTTMNGFEAARRIKSEPEAPIVVLTTFHDSEAARNEAWAAGAELLVAKADVTARVREVIKDLAAGRVPGEIENKARASKHRTESLSPSVKRVPKGDLTQ